MDPYAEQFWAYTQKKELRLQKCSDCGKFRWPPGPTCDKCLSDEAEWAAIAGRGQGSLLDDLPPQATSRNTRRPTP